MCLAPSLKLREAERVAQIRTYVGGEETKVRSLSFLTGQKTWRNVSLGKKCVLRGERMEVKLSRLRTSSPLPIRPKQAFATAASRL